MADYSTPTSIKKVADAIETLAATLVEISRYQGFGDAALSFDGGSARGVAELTSGRIADAIEAHSHRVESGLYKLADAIDRLAEAAENSNAN